MDTTLRLRAEYAKEEAEDLALDLALCSFECRVRM